MSQSKKRRRWSSEDKLRIVLAGMEPGVEISVRLESSDDQVRVRVCDTGNPVAPHVAELLFRSPVKSRNGLGIGLYQAAIMANAFQFELELSQNERGRVCFNLFQHLVE